MGKPAATAPAPLTVIVPQLSGRDPLAERLAHPETKAEVIVDYGLTNIVAERYDAGVRLGEQVARDSIYPLPTSS